jgi:hypothetical protein
MESMRFCYKLQIKRVGTAGDLLNCDLEVAGLRLWDIDKGG